MNQGEIYCKIYSFGGCQSGATASDIELFSDIDLMYFYTQFLQCRIHAAIWNTFEVFLLLWQMIFENIAHKQVIRKEE